MGAAAARPTTIPRTALFREWEMRPRPNAPILVRSMPLQFIAETFH